MLRQACSPPASGRIFSTPLRLRSSATRALVASLGQVQYKMTSGARASSSRIPSRLSPATRRAPGMVVGSAAKSTDPRRSTITTSWPISILFFSSSGVMRSMCNCRTGSDRQRARFADHENRGADRTQLPGIAPIRLRGRSRSTRLSSRASVRSSPPLGISWWMMPLPAVIH